MSEKKSAAERAVQLVNARNGGVLLAASAAAVAAWQEIEHRKVLRADLPDAHIRVERLSDLRDDPPSIDAVEAGLRTEWGAFGLLGFDSGMKMAKEAGQTIFIASLVEAGEKTPIGSLQTILADCHGDPELLRDEFANFAELTGRLAWRRSRRKGGDTAVLLQITVFAKDGRGGGVGSTLRDAVLHMLPDNVHFAITTTPADGKAIDAENYKSYNPAMRFHAKGGAKPTLLLEGFKVPAEGEVPSPHGQDVMVMRYSRDEEGNWSVPRPEMRTRSMGPMQRQATYAVKELEALGKRSGTAIKGTAIKGLARTKRARVHAADAKAWIIDHADSLGRRSKKLLSKRKRSQQTPGAATEGEAAS